MIDIKCQTVTGQSVLNDVCILETENVYSNFSINLHSYTYKTKRKRAVFRWAKYDLCYKVIQNAQAWQKINKNIV